MAYAKAKKSGGSSNDDPTSQRPEVDGKPNIKFWIAQLDAAKRAAKDSEDAFRDAYEEYLVKYQLPDTLKNARRKPDVRYPIFWASVRTIQPALYSRTPIPVAEKVFDSLEDNVGRLGCLCLERLAKYLMRCCPFDRVQYAARDNFILGAKATTRVCFEAEISETPKRVGYSAVETQDEAGQPMTVYVDAQGNAMPDGTELLQDEEGIYAESMEENLEGAYVQVLPVQYEEILHTPNARHWEEIDFIAFKSLMTRADVVDKFGDEVATEIQSTFQSYVDVQKKKDREILPTKYACVWEIWDKRRRSVYWYAEGHTEDFITPLDYDEGDPYDLDGFFPCAPFMLGTCGPDSLYPVCDYLQLKALILQLHGLYRRLKMLIAGSVVRGIFDGGIPELNALQTLDDAQWIGVKNMTVIKEKGGLANLIDTFPTQEIAATISQITQVAQMYEQQFNEIYGIPDILRGVSDPNETAAAQQLKGKFLSLRFSAVQREFQRLVRDSIELMCDLALKKFTDEKLIDICGVNFMPPEDQQLWPQVVVLLRDDDERKVRIDIETDSTITMNEGAEIEQTNYLAKTLFDGLSAMGSLAETAPEMKPVIAKVVELTVEGTRKGKEVSEDLARAFRMMMQPQEPQPPPPDYEGMKIQNEQMKIQNEAQAKAADQQLKGLELESNAQLKTQELNLKAQELTMEAVDKQVKQALESQSVQFTQEIEKLYAQLEQYRVVLDEREKYMTEARLQMEADRKAQMEMISMQRPEAPAHPPIMVNVDANRPKRSVSKIIRDELGNSTVVTEELPPAEV